MARSSSRSRRAYPVTCDVHRQTLSSELPEQRSSSVPPGSVTWSWPSRFSGYCVRRNPAWPIDVVGPPWSVPLVGRMPEVRRGIPLAVRARRVRPRGPPGARRDAASRAIRAGHRAAAFLQVGAGALVRGHSPADRLPLRTARHCSSTMSAGLTGGCSTRRSSGFSRSGCRPAHRCPRRRRRRCGWTRPIGTCTARPALVSASGRRIALMPGAAYGPAKQWPLESFSELARTADGPWRRGVGPGFGRRAVLGEQIRAGAGGQVFNLCGQTSLEDSVDLLSAARAAVTNDSGLMHIAAAAGTHVVAIYGSSSPRLHAAADRPQGHSVPGAGLQSLLPARVPAGAPELPAADQSAERAGGARRRAQSPARSRLSDPVQHAPPRGHYGPVSRSRAASARCTLAMDCPVRQQLPSAACQVFRLRP